MKQLIELGAVRIGAAIQNVYANVDFDVLSLPGGSLIAVLLWLYARAANSMSRRPAACGAISLIMRLSRKCRSRLPSCGVPTGMAIS
jgi:hypothetical protein